MRSAAIPIVVISIFFLISSASNGQVPDVMSYQAVLRDGDDQLLTNHEVGVQISILEESIFGASVYVETHLVSTNRNGLVSLEIGGGTPVIGDFADIDWGENAYFIKTETDPSGGTDYSITTTQQLLTVPYAFHAKNAETLSGPINEADPIFQSSVAAGITSQDTAFWNAGLTESDPTWTGMSNDTSTISRQGSVGIGVMNPSAILHTGEDVLFNDLTIGKGRGEGQFSTAVGIDALSANQDGLSNTGLGYQTLRNNTRGSGNTAIGTSSLQNNTSGNGNTAIGSNALISNKTGEGNVSIGRQSMFLCDSPKSNIAIGSKTLYNSNGIGNIALGEETLNNDTEGFFNVGIGHQALHMNQTGYENTAIGYHSLYSNVDGIQNIAIGSQALKDNTDGTANIGIGSSALEGNTSGTSNVGIGSLVLRSNTTGRGNVALGTAMIRNRTGIENVAIGSGTLINNLDGHFNIAIGSQTMVSNLNGERNLAMGLTSLSNLQEGINNIALGTSTLSSITSGNDNVALGAVAGNGSQSSVESTFVGVNTFTNVDNISNVTALGYFAIITANNQVRVGNSSVTSIGGQVGWSVISDGRFKQSVRNNVKGLDFINKLRPVTYSFSNTLFRSWLSSAGFEHVAEKKAEISTQNDIRYSGFIAQEVEQAASESGYDFSGIDHPKNENDYYGLRYASFTVPLVQAVQEMSDQLDEQAQQLQLQNESIQALRAENERLEEKLENLTQQFSQLMEDRKQ